jgi:hypothetical protein
MPQLFQILLLGFSALLPFLWSLTSLTLYTPQLIALGAVITIILSIKHKSYFIYPVSFVINLIVFTTSGLNSPAFFLIYFLLFVIAFQNPPTTTLSFSLVLVLLLSQSLDSLSSLLPLLSLLFVTPVAYFVGRQYLETTRLTSAIQMDETDVFLWFSLTFKTGIQTIIDLSSQLLSNPSLSNHDQESSKAIKDSAKSLLKSAGKLTQKIDETTDET